MQLCRTKVQNFRIFLAENWIKCFPGKNPTKSRGKSGKITGGKGRSGLRDGEEVRGRPPRERARTEGTDVVVKRGKGVSRHVVLERRPSGRGSLTSILQRGVGGWRGEGGRARGGEDFSSAHRFSRIAAPLGGRFVRMLKLIRAIKFMSKLNKLKQQEGFEVRDGWMDGWIEGWRQR